MKPRMQRADPALGALDGEAAACDAAPVACSVSRMSSIVSSTEPIPFHHAAAMRLAPLALTREPLHHTIPQRRSGAWSRTRRPIRLRGFPAGGSHRPYVVGDLEVLAPRRARTAGLPWSGMRAGPGSAAAAQLFSSAGQPQADGARPRPGSASRPSPRHMHAVPDPPPQQEVASHVQLLAHRELLVYLRCLPMDGMRLGRPQVIDLHCHILPGIDDAQSRQQHRNGAAGRR